MLFSALRKEGSEGKAGTGVGAERKGEDTQAKRFVFLSDVSEGEILYRAQQGCHEYCH
jgi:hypothetical protein